MGIGDLLEGIFIWYRVVSVVVLLLGLLGAGIYLWRYLRSQWKFGKNLKRTVYFLKTSEELNLQSQKERLKKLKLFNLDEEIKDISNPKNGNILQSLDDNAVFIVGYELNYNYEKLFDHAQSKRIPIIIFAPPGKVIGKSWELFGDYIYCDVANTTNRLAIILLNVLKIV